MSTVLLVMTNGRRELLEQTLESFREQVTGDITSVYVNDDSADPFFGAWLNDNLRSLVFRDVPIVVRTTPEPSGFGGAIRNAWSWLEKERRSVWSSLDPFDFVFHLEDDFTFNHKIDLTHLQDLLIAYPYLAQMALKRQPWGSDAHCANGFMENDPGSYEQRENMVYEWVETRKNWTTNPALFRADLLPFWPPDPHSEGIYGFHLKEHGLPWGVSGDGVKFGIFGRIEDPPLVHHIGTYRTGTGY